MRHAASPLAIVPGSGLGAGLRVLRPACVALAVGAAACDGGGDGDGDGDTDAGPAPAAVTDPSSPCPAITGTGDYTFSVNGEDRETWIGIPDPAVHEGPYRVVFAFHGMAPTGYDASGDIRRGMDLDSLVEEQGVIVVAPTARSQSLAITTVLLWGILDEPGRDADLQFVDDMRSCLVDQANADVRGMHAIGFSGGGLWTSLLVMDRADVFASAVPMSGGVDTFPQMLDWRDPAASIPVLLMDGGPSDTWPTPEAPIIDFHEATDSFQAHLLGGGHTVGTCEHSSGHYYPPSEMRTLARRWMLRHRFGEASPWAEGDGDVPEGCLGPLDL